MADPNSDVINSLLADIDSLAQEEAPLSFYEKALGYSRSALSGPTLNFGDNLEAALFSPFTDKTYSQELEGIRSEQDRFKRLTDYTDNATELVASIFNPIGSYDKLGGASSLALNSERIIPKVSGPVEKALGMIPESVQTVFMNPAAQAAIAGAGAANGRDVLWNAGIGAGVGTAGSIFANKLGSTLSRPGYEADRLMTSAYGVSPAAISKTINRMANPTERILDAEVLPIVKTIEKYAKAGIINPEQSLTDRVTAITAHKDSIGNQLGDLLTVADQAIPPVKDFQLNTVGKYINSFEGPAREAAARDADEIYAALTNRLGKGELADLQRLKVGLNYKFSPTDSAYKPDIYRAFRSDLRQEIEDRVDTAAKTGLLPKDLVGQVKAFNREWGDAQELSDIYSRNQGRDFAGDLVTDVTSSASTTGGSPTGGLMLMSGVTGNPAWATAGALGRAANLPTAKAKISGILRDAEKAKFIAPLAKTLEELGTARTFEQGYESARSQSNVQESAPKQLSPSEVNAQKIIGLLAEINGNIEKPNQNFFIQDMKTKQESNTTPDASFKNKATAEATPKPMAFEDFQPLEPDKTIESGTKAGMRTSQISNLANSVFGDNKPMQNNSNNSNKPPEIKAVEAQIDADPYTKTLYEFESSRNPYAKNKESSAKGGFQFVDATAKALGLEDPMDLAASYEAVKKLIEADKANFGDDPIMLYSAHYLGAPTLKKVLAGEPLEEKQLRQFEYLRDVLIPKFKRMYEANLKNILV